MKKALVVGGGFAGLSVAIELASSGYIETTLVDKNVCFLNTLALHKTHLISLSDLQIPYQQLADRHGFTFRQIDIGFSPNDLFPFDQPSPFRVKGLDDIFDFIILCTGSKTANFRASSSSILYDLEYLKKNELSKLLSSDSLHIGIIGGGATGVQYAFELNKRIKNQADATVSILTTQAGLLDQFPLKFASYAHKQAQKTGIKIEYLTKVQNILKNGLELKRADGTTKINDYNLIFNFSGIKAIPELYQCNHFGQFILKNQIKAGIYAAGDNSHFAGQGLNAATAQSAVRKGKTVAQHIISMTTTLAAKPYNYQSLGYFVSLGLGDGIGWLLNKSAITAGIAAFAIKESIEYQFQLFLDGYNTYL